MSSTPVIIVKTFAESDEIMKTSSEAVVRFQFGNDAHAKESLSEDSLRNMIKNFELFWDLFHEYGGGRRFIIVTEGTLCYWSFFKNGKWDHSNEHSSGTIGYDGKKIRATVSELFSN